MNTYLLISIIINLFLAVLLFFKSSINNIVLEWWKERRSQRNDKISILNKIKVTLEKATIYYIIILIDALQLQQNPEIINNIDYKNRNSETAKKLGNLLDEISISERFYPSSLRVNIKNFISKNSAYLVQILDNKNTVSIYKLVKEVQDESDKIIREIEEIVFNNN